jgi:uncharacterized protein
MNGLKASIGVRVIARLTFALFLLFGTLAAAAEPQFPALTGRVVDDAHILSAATVQTLDQTLADYERGTTNQVVVVTVPSLQGNAIEDYGYKLGRFWQIGQKGKNNGVLLIVAPNDRKVRIEVGYGLEPVLTDAASSQILTGIILPAFGAGHMEQGIISGTEAIVSVLGGKGIPAEAGDQAGAPASGLDMIVMLVLGILFFGFALRHPFIAAMLLSSGSSRFGGSYRGDSDRGGGFGGGGFSGGGGGFGGGGSSGSW